MDHQIVPMFIFSGAADHGRIRLRKDIIVGYVADPKLLGVTNLLTAMSAFQVRESVAAIDQAWIMASNAPPALINVTDLEAKLSGPSK